MTENNTFLPINPVIPGTLIITDITATCPMVLTFTDDLENTYILGQIVKLTIPYTYGMFQANQLNGKIIAINGNKFTLALDASQFDQFSLPMGDVSQPASLSPAGSNNLQYNNFTNRVAFQPLNNIGN